MSNHLTVYPAVIVLLALTVLPNSFALAGETITVHLTSGRNMTAEVDPRTNDTKLWLRFGDLNLSLLRPVDWSAIEAMTADGDPIDKAAIMASLPAVEPAELIDEIPGNAVVIQDAQRDVPYAEQAQESIGFAPRATHIDFYTKLANWDNDPQPDGLLLYISLLDADYQPLAASGSLQAELFAPVQRRFSAVPHGRGASVLPIARWSEAIRQEDYRHGEVVIRLPFRAAKHTATDLAAYHGLLHVRVAVPGHGVFEASYDGIRIVPFAPTRDILQRQGLPRTLYTEPPHRTGNVR